MQPGSNLFGYVSTTFTSWFKGTRKIQQLLNNSTCCILRNTCMFTLHSYNRCCWGRLTVNQVVRPKPAALSVLWKCWLSHTISLLWIWQCDNSVPKFQLIVNACAKKNQNSQFNYRPDKLQDSPLNTSELKPYLGQGHTRLQPCPSSPAVSISHGDVDMAISN